MPTRTLRCRSYGLPYFRGRFVMRLYKMNAAAIIAMNPRLLADSRSMPNNMHRLVTKLFVSSAPAIKIIGRHTLYPLIPATLLTPMLSDASRSSPHRLLESIIP